MKALFHTPPSFSRGVKWGEVYPVVDIGNKKLRVEWDFTLIEHFLGSFDESYSSVCHEMRNSRPLSIYINRGPTNLYRLFVSETGIKLQASRSITCDGLCEITDTGIVPRCFRRFIYQVRKRYGNVFEAIASKVVTKETPARRVVTGGCLADAISCFRGYKVISVQSDNPFRASRIGNSNWIDRDGVKGYLQYLTVMLPYAVDAFNWSTVIEIDASFKASTPYCYYLITCVKNNNSIPIGFTLGPSENEGLFNHTFDVLVSLLTESDSRLSDKYYLSDFGEAIRSFIDKHGLTDRHYYCSRHYINTFGAGSFFQPIVSSLLFSRDYEDFHTIVNQSKEEIEVYTKCVGFNNIKTHLLRLSQLTGLFFNGKSWERVTPVLFDHLVRFQRGFSTCSNHIESQHRKLNEETEGKDFMQRVCTIYNYCYEKYRRAKDTPSINTTYH